MNKPRVSDILNYLLALVGAFLVGVGCFGAESIIDAFKLQNIGISELTVLAITLWIGYEWKKIYVGIRDDEFDEFDIALTSRYMRMSFFITITLWSGLFFVKSSRFQEFRYAIKATFVGAKASYDAFILGGFFLLLLTTTLYFIWKWIELRFSP